MEYICWACGNKHKIEAQYPQQVMPIRDVNGNWFCPNCYKEYGKPDLSDIKNLLMEVNKGGAQPPSFVKQKEVKQGVSEAGTKLEE